ncbi:MAG: MBL fold metallo-hydrolase [Solirubrobacteraceae bacterium]
MRVHLCGVRGSTPAPGPQFVRYGGHTSCVALVRDGAQRPTLILDTGTGVRTVPALLAGAAFQGTILYSHLHWDHFNGLPFFASADRDDARTSLYYPEPVPPVADAEALLERAMSPPHFPITPKQLSGDWTFATLREGEHEIEGFTVLAREIPHRGGRAFGYRISDERTALAYMPDHGPRQLGPGEDGLGAYHPAALELARAVDWLIHDATLTRAELTSPDGDRGHSAAEYVVALAARAGARTPVLFHHGPERTDAELDALAAGLPDTIVAAQGGVLAL